MKQATAVRLFLLGLPLGLILTTTVSLLWHFNQPKEAGPPVIYTDLAEEITTSELSSYVHNLSTVIGQRHLSEPGTLERASNYIESTLGPLNVGFEVAEQVFEVDGQAVRNLWVEIPGGKRLNECVVVVAHYDAPTGGKGSNDNASAVAALLALAENFVQDQPTLTLRLAWLVNGTPPHVGTANSGAAHFSELLKRQGDVVRAVFCLDSVGAFPQSPPLAAADIQPYLPQQGPFLSLLGRAEATSLLGESSSLLSERLPITVHQASLPDDVNTVFNEQGVTPFQSDGFPAVLVCGNALFNQTQEWPVLDFEPLTEVTQTLATLLRILTNPS